MIMMQKKLKKPAKNQLTGVFIFLMFNTNLLMFNIIFLMFNTNFSVLHIAFANN